METEKWFDLTVNTEGEKVSKTFELDKNITLLKGLCLSSNKEHLLYYRGSVRLEINGQEIFAEGYESKRLYSSPSVAPDDRKKTLNDLEPGNGKIKLEYQDSPSAEAPFSPYRVRLYVLCEFE